MYWITLVSLSIRLGIKLFNSFQEDESILLSLISFWLLGLSFVCFIAFIVLLIINFKKNKNIKIKVFIMLGSLLLIYILLNVIPSKFIETREEKYVKQMNNLVNLVKNDKSDKMIYKLKDLQNLDTSLNESPFDLSYNEESYVLKLDNEIYVCFSDGKHKVSGSAKSLEYSEPWIFKKCEFRFTSGVAATYVERELEKKYQKEFEILECKRPSSPIFGSGENYLRCECKEENKEDDFSVTIYDDLQMHDSYLEYVTEEIIKKEISNLIETVLGNNNYDLDIDVGGNEYENVSEIRLDNLAQKFTILIFFEAYNPVSEKQLSEVTEQVGEWMLNNQVYGNCYFRKKQDSEGDTELKFDLKVKETGEKEIIKKNYKEQAN